MNCNQVRELLPDVAAGMEIDKKTEDVQNHISSCSTCAAKLQGFRQTMALLDQWETPEPGPYFDTRLGARLREEMARPAMGWLHWLPRPAVAALALAIVAGGLAFTNRGIIFPGEQELAISIPVPGVPVEPGSAVGDLQALERNHELYADFDVLDELQVQDEVTANP